MTWLASRGLLRRALRRPVGPSSSARAVATDAGVVPAAARKYSRPQVQPPLNAKKARGLDILNDPLWNKGTAFSVAERDRLGLKGLLPPVVKTIEEQRDGFLRKMREQRDPVDQNLLLRGLHDRNETLFHRVLVDCIDECAPLVYTPTVGQACQKFSAQYVRQRGLTLTPDDRGCMGILMENWGANFCQVAVVTDGSRILGLGDLGANGMGIPIGASFPSYHPLHPCRYAGPLCESVPSDHPIVLTP